MTGVSATVQVLHHDVAPGCDVADGDPVRLQYGYYAEGQGFLGGGSNKCLQNLVIRYNKYNKTAYEAFIEEVHKYLFQDLTIYGMCMAFSNVSNDERERRKLWVKEKLTTISSQLLNVQEVFEEASLCRWSTTVHDVPTSRRVHSVVTNAMTLYAGGIKKMAGRERPTRYQGLIEYIVHTVKGEYTRLRQDYMGASYFVKWTEHPTSPEVLRSRIAFLKDGSNEDVAWDTIVNQYDEDFCGQMKATMRDTRLTRNGTYLGQTTSKESSGFTAVIAVRCTNEFVWYELGWRYYFAAATTASDYVVSRADGEYSNSCGQLIFLP
ncbi:hypothetical protein AAVH_42959 [Aphelenchoides avenae]|nr:hypothetical protein AAVH_42959 [Aphelenchus avenae]